MIPEKGKFLVDFYADWCGPCKAMNSTLEKFTEESNVKLLKCNVDKESEAPKKYGVRSIPCFIVVEDGLEINRKIGMQTLDQLKKLVE